MRILWRPSRTVVGMVGVLVLVALLTFALQTALPGNAAEIRVGPATGMTPAERHQEVLAVSRQLGLDKSYPEQFVRWLWGALHGDFGRTVDGDSVSGVIAMRLGPTIELAIAGILLAVALALGSALWAHVTRRRRVAAALESLWSMLLVVPQFWIGFLLVLAFSVYLGAVPGSGYVAFSDSPVQNLERLALPATTLALPSAAVIFRYLYAGLSEAAAEPFATAALAKGISARRLLLRHILPNGALPAITIVGLLFGTMLGGVVIVENVFSWPGIGTLLVTAIERQDFAVVSASVLVVATGFVITSALVDLLYGLLDPRTRRA